MIEALAEGIKMKKELRVSTFQGLITFCIDYRLG
jgi:hypothetical protein